MNLSLGFSPCPNDTFIFDALVNGKISSENFQFDVSLADVEMLNNSAFSESIDITKLSVFAYAKVSQTYQMLTSGAALGFNNGPLLISKKPFNVQDVNSLRIAIPGINTTANFLFSHFFPLAKNKREYIFSDIERAIAYDEVDVGLIIHETRFTYKDHGFIDLVDFGKLWEQTYKLPIPLGCIAVKRSLPDEVKHKVNELIRKSVLYGFEHKNESLEYSRAHSQELTDDVIQQHISLYVNQFSVDFGKVGKDAILFLYEKAYEQKAIPKIKNDIFVG